MLTYPAIDPVALQLGPLAIRWYSLAYIGGILCGWWYLVTEHKRKPIANLSRTALDDTVTWAVIGIIAGGRLGHVFFYNPSYYLSYPQEILYIWEGGMSFHGGLIGVIVAFWLFCKKHKAHFLALMDVISCAVPIGLFFGRLANFINGELFGRVTDSPLGMVFPYGGDSPRHPSQLYEAAMEGIVLFAVMTFALKRTKAREKEGLLAGIFLIGYALARSSMEQFRQPDGYVNLFIGEITIGQFLSLPMLLIGLYLVFRKQPKGNTTS